MSTAEPIAMMEHEDEVAVHTVPPADRYTWRAARTLDEAASWTGPLGPERSKGCERGSRRARSTGEGVGDRHQGRHRQERGGDGAGVAGEQVSDHGDLTAATATAGAAADSG